MATSGTNVFENTFPIDEIFEEAYERVGMRDVTGYHLTSARRSLNIMLQEWANRGLHYWELSETNIDLVEGQAEYTFFRATTDGTSAVTTAPPLRRLKSPPVTDRINVDFKLRVSVVKTGISRLTSSSLRTTELSPTPPATDCSGC